MSGWVSSSSDLINDSGIGLSPAAAHLRCVSHAGAVALAVTDRFASIAVSAAALVAPDESVVAVALSLTVVVTPNICMICQMLETDNG